METLTTNRKFLIFFASFPPLYVPTPSTHNNNQDGSNVLDGISPLASGRWLILGGKSRLPNKWPRCSLQLDGNAVIMQPLFRMSPAGTMTWIVEGWPIRVDTYKGKKIGKKSENCVPLNDHRAIESRFGIWRVQQCAHHQFISISCMGRSRFLDVVEVYVHF